MPRPIAVLTAAALVACTFAVPARAHVSGHSERLAARARRGDRVARTALVEEHMGLVRSIAFRYRDLGLPVDDLVQEGAIGLLAAIDDYDPSRGASFSTFAFWRVRAAVTHALTAHGQLVRVPRTLLERRREVARARERLRVEGRAASIATLADVTTLRPAEVAATLAPTGVSSLDDPFAERTALGAIVPADQASSPESQLSEHERVQALRVAVRLLPHRQRTIVSRHFGLAGEPETLREIAADLDLSPERTRALKDEALRELAVALAPAVAP